MKCLHTQVCVSGYAFRRVYEYKAETWHIFEATPSKFKGHPEVKLP